jgi:hypothetical protein
MKKTFLLLIAIFCITTVSAQDDEDIIRWHYSFGAVVNPDFKINDNLMAAGNHRIADVSPSVSFGWSVETKNRIKIDVDFGVATTLYGKKNSGYNLVQIPVSLKVQYALINKEKFAFAAGLNGSYVFYDLNIYNDESEIDLNNLNPALSTGYIRMNNQSAYVGPVLSFTFLKHKSHPLTLSMGYDFAVTNSKWKSDYATLSNTVKENGGRVYLQLNIPFGTIGNMWGDSGEE